MKDLHRDEWLGTRISDALDAIRHAEYAGLETALDLVAFAEDVLKHYGPPEATGPVVDVRFTFREGPAEADGYVPLDLVGIERVRCDLDEEQQFGVGEDWGQSDRYSIGYTSDLIGVVSAGEKADYSEKGPRLW